MTTLTRRLYVAIAVIFIGIMVPLLEQTTSAQVLPKGKLTATQPCPASRKIEGDNPGNVKLVVGNTYDTVGFNSSTRTHILLKISGVTPNQRWVKSSCGNFQASSSSGPSSGNVSLLPFFDNTSNPISVDFPAGGQKDITPPPPQLEPFDRRVLAMCGAGFNASVSEQSFRTLLRDFPDVFSKLKTAAGGSLKPNRSSDAAFTDDLVQIWFAQRGFKHILCGETDDKQVNNVPNLGGLHFYGRYLQLQNQSGTKAGRFISSATKQEVVDGSIYTFGTRVVRGNVKIAEAPIKGYSYVLSAQEILIHATKASKLFNPPASQSSASCLLTVADPAAAPFQAVFVKKEGAILTFYPDATPEGSACGP
ncbi:MAG: EndoU domain-containing protein [Acaryochloridaceae cyanobacterium RU_4_10]|nr:EndoU domain-containing protein [Acaryochloridaceae cyanobacterium RU_4_10]